MKKGHISVFLALVTLIMLSLVITLIEGARIGAMRLRAECVADIGISSAFAEFHRELLEQYDLFFIDSSYGRQTSDKSNTEQHILNYVDDNFSVANPLEVFYYRDWYGLRGGRVSINEFSLASDEKGNILKKQISLYQKEKTPIALWDKVSENIQITKGNSLTTKNIAEESNQIETQIQNTEMPKIEVEPDKWEEMQINNPADAVNQKRGGGILHLVVDDMEEISSKSVSLENVASHRKLSAGNGFYGRKEYIPSAFDEFLINEYLLDKCGYYKHFKNKNVLQYQIEYILQGKDADAENLEKTVKQLLKLREVSNAIYLFSDSVKIGQADAMAAGLSAVAAVPSLQPLIKYSLLFAWSYAESVNDVKMILAGGKVPLLKSNEHWYLSIENMLLFQKYLSSEKKQQKGLSYEDYLRIFLHFMDTEEKIMRFMDIVEMDIKNTQGNDSFAIDGCMDRLLAEIEIHSGYGYSFLFKKEYEYYR